MPFKSKSNHFDKARDSDFFEYVVTENERRIRSLYFQHHSSSRNEHYVEAVLTALLTHGILQTVKRSAFVLVDGDRKKANDFARAFAGFGGSPPATANCYQSECYYPHALLADLSAGYLAHKLRTGKYDHVDPLLRTLPADRKRSEKWGRAFDYLQTNSEPEYQWLGVESAYAKSERGRAKVWFDGEMGRSPGNTPPSVSLTTITSHLKNEGYATVAKRLREL